MSTSLLLLAFRPSARLAPLPLLLAAFQVTACQITACQITACQAAPAALDAGGAEPAPAAEALRTVFPLSGVSAEVGTAGLHLAPRGGGAGWTLRLDAWGRSERLTPLPPAPPLAGPGGRVDVHRDGLTEWWVLGGGAGLAGEVIEHGWTVDRAPPGVGPVRFALGATGAVGAVEAGELEAGAVAWTDGGGRRWAYTQLSAFDAAGTTLPARFVAADGAVYVEVDDTGATWPVTVDPLLSTAQLTVSGETAFANFGSGMASAGDFNGDGQEETLISAAHYVGYTGRVYFNWGTADGFTWNRPDLLDPDDGSSTEPFFSTVAGLGDVNADGFDDFVVGGPGYNQSTGRVWLYMGVNAVPSSVTAIPFDGEATFSFFGQTLAGLGDVNGDGYPDAAVGAYGYNDYTGRVYVYFGSADGLVAAQTLDGVATYTSFGRSVAAAGDLNADGYADLLVGAPGDAKALGRLYVYLGSADGLVAGPTRTGAEATDSFGSAAAGVGDLDADGYADVVVGSPADLAYTGRIYVYRGGPDGLDTALPVIAEGSEFGAGLGTSIAAVGDIDADGCAEVLVGAPGVDNYRGNAVLYTGRITGFDTDPITTLEGEEPGDYFGIAMAPLGDRDGDGYRDAMVGATNAVNLTGRVYMYRGYPPSDDDLDGYDETLDCDDTNPDAYPGAEEVPANGVDEDCDGGETCYVDADADAYRPEGAGTLLSEDSDCTDPGEAGANVPTGDCDDTDASVHPGATEVAGDGIDQDCDGKDTAEHDPTGKTTDPKVGGCGCAVATDRGSRREVSPSVRGHAGIVGGSVAALLMLRRRRAAPAAPPPSILR